MRGGRTHRLPSLSLCFVFLRSLVKTYRGYTPPKDGKVDSTADDEGRVVGGRWEAEAAPSFVYVQQQSIADRPAQRSVKSGLSLVCWLPDAQCARTIHAVARGRRSCLQ
ncbi:hypothetical protein B0H16DRAFT_1640126 [Mycena metata]|uniref:Secreted protein n=1 Tax=Mycena metata TaxID=1033252 RepID=A0AAD7DYV3_9AGAR|nr:hypothetical protein B0H16DRAFT_1640126 [Mycena metata]